MEENKIENHVFIKMVESMKYDGFLQDEEAINLKQTYNRYIDNLKLKKEAAIKTALETPVIPAQNQEEKIFNPYEVRQTPQINNQQKLEYIPIKEPIVPRVITKDEIRERNLSWILNIGVVLILLSGIIFGTSTWGFMNNISKAVLLCSVSVVFFGISIIAKVFIKIEKSSNAFWIMGSLLLPISLLSIGFFKLFGEYFSVWGDGKYAFGVLCTIICLPIYIWSTYRNSSRTFAWITLIDISLMFTFFSLSFYATIGVLTLLLLSFNCLLIAIIILSKKIDKFSIFLSEVPLFLQFNLILTTAITLFAYNETYLYSINIVIASMLFFAISLTQKKDGYDYVFGLLFTGGMFLLSREFNNQSATFVISSLVGYVFSGISNIINNDVSKGIRYRIFSGVSALIGFIYVAANIFTSSSLQDSVIGLVALCLITINYIYLTYKTKSAFFGIIVPIQVIIIFYQSVNLLYLHYKFEYVTELLLLLTVLLFVVGYMFNKIEKFKYIKQSSLVVSFISTIFIFIISVFVEPLIISLPIIVFVLILQLFIFGRSIENRSDKILLNYVISILLFFSLCLIRYSYTITAVLPDTFYFICALTTFLLHFVAVGKLNEFKKPLFYSGHVLMILTYLYILINNLPTLELESSFVSLLAFCIITINHIYLAYKKETPFFGIIVPIQAIIIIYHSGILLAEYYNFKYFSEYLLIMTMLLFVGGYMFNKIERFKYAKKSSLVMSLINTLAIFALCDLDKPLLLNLSIIGFVFTAQIFIFSRTTTNVILKEVLNYCFSFLLFGSLCLIRSSYSIYNIEQIAFYFFCALLTFLLHFVAIKKLKDLGKPLFYCGHFIMATIFFIILKTNQHDLIYTYIYLLLGLTYLYSVYKTENKYEKNLWLYAGFVNFTILVGSIISQIKYYFDADFTKYSIFICGFLILGLYFLLKNIELKKHTIIYSCIITALIIYSNLPVPQMLWYEYIAEIAFAGLLCVCMFKSKLDILALIPLTLVYTANNVLVNMILKDSIIFVPIIVIWFTVLSIIGMKKYEFVFDMKNRAIDWFSILAFISIFNLPYKYSDFNILWLVSMIPGLLGAIWFYFNRKRLAIINDDNRFGNLLFTLSLLWPYYSLLVEVNKDIKDYIYELVLLPLVFLTYIIAKWIYRGIKNSFTSILEYMVPSAAYVILLVAMYYSDNITHSLILGAVGLISVLYAMVFKTKSSLILGGALILTSVFIQTRTFWFNVQWWIYLLVLGLILIIVASINEYQKNKYNEDVIKKTSKYLDKFADWE